MRNIIETKSWRNSYDVGLSIRIAQHLPTNLMLNGPKLPSSAIGIFIIDSRRVFNKTKAFKVITRARNAQLLRFAEASAIRRIKPDLCVQKDLVVRLALPCGIIIQPCVLLITLITVANIIVILILRITVHLIGVNHIQILLTAQVIALPSF